MLRQTTHADLISVVTAAIVTLSVQAALSFQKYRFNKGLVLGTTMAAVNWYEVVTRRKAFATVTRHPDPDRHHCRGLHGRCAAGSSRLGCRLAPHALVTHLC